MKLSLSLVFMFLVCLPVFACTIFVLTDGTRALLFNNEDWLNPNTRIWFVPAGDGHYGCAYVGFNDGRAQGGLNTEGLAFDWVAGYMEKWIPDAGLQRVRGNPSERMLETSATVEDAILMNDNCLVQELGLYEVTWAVQVSLCIEWN